MLSERAPAVAATQFSARGHATGEFLSDGRLTVYSVSKPVSGCHYLARETA